MLKIIVFIPKKFSEKVKEEMFKAGAGKFKNYDCCSFETEGIGQFRPLKNAKPFVGTIEKLEKVIEVRVEMICDEQSLEKVVSAMRKSHPYEEVAFDVISLVKIK
jgi:structural toxin protein (hemagglutinin/hemolysin) RtxA